MKKLLLLFVCIQTYLFAQTQSSKGKIIVERIHFPSLQNTGEEETIRRVTIYLPPNYDQTTNRYPVIYYLHGFTESDSLMITPYRFDTLLDKAIISGLIRPVIVAMPNEHTLYRGSFYTNSSLTGNWADFTAKDVVRYVDAHYRTMANKDSRGITGFSMGGGGAIKLGMLYPDVFSVVYGSSPGPLAVVEELGATGESFKKAQNIQSREELLKDVNFMATLLVAMGRTYSPNPSKPPFYCDLPFTYNGDSLVTDYQTLKLWNKNMPFEMVDDYVGNLKKLQALKFDWGRNDEIAFIIAGCKMFSKKLENYGINHYAEEFIGTHGDKLLTDDGRELNAVLPFFDKYLKFEELKFTKSQYLKK